jgi:hypothetical protein
VPKPAKVTNRLKLSSNPLKMREVRDGLREKIRAFAEGKLFRRAIKMPPKQIDVTDARIDVGKTISCSERMSRTRAPRAQKTSGQKWGNAVDIFSRRRRVQADAYERSHPFDACPLRAIDTKCYGTGMPIRGLLSDQ